MKNTTPVPNAVFELVPSLCEAELKLYLIILRQTLGWKDARSQKRKVYDWISSSQFQSKTGLSRRAIVTAIGSLSFRNLILIADDHGKVLHTPKDRKGKSRLYYRIAVEKPVQIPEDNHSSCENFADQMRKSCEALAQNLRCTKETPTK